MRGYLDLMKLRVVELLLISTLPAMVLAAKGLPSFSLVAATIFAGTLSAGSANAFNMVIESDIDKLMARTSKRPIVTGVISKTNAAIFATLQGTNVTIPSQTYYCGDFPTDTVRTFASNSIASTFTVNGSSSSMIINYNIIQGLDTIICSSIYTKQ